MASFMQPWPSGAAVAKWGSRGRVGQLWLSGAAVAEALPFTEQLATPLRGHIEPHCSVGQRKVWGDSRVDLLQTGRLTQA